MGLPAILLLLVKERRLHNQVWSRCYYSSCFFLLLLLNVSVVMERVGWQMFP